MGPNSNAMIDTIENVDARNMLGQFIERSTSAPPISSSDDHDDGKDTWAGSVSARDTLAVFSRTLFLREAVE